MAVFSTTTSPFNSAISSLKSQALPKASSCPAPAVSDRRCRNGSIVAETPPSDAATQLGDRPPHLSPQPATPTCHRKWPPLKTGAQATPAFRRAAAEETSGRDETSEVAPAGPSLPRCADVAERWVPAQRSHRRCQRKRRHQQGVGMASRYGSSTPEKASSP